MSTSFDVPQQFCLFELAKDLARIREDRELLMRSARAVNTFKAYDHAWSVFTRWSSEYGLTALPATPETVQLFVAWAYRQHQYRLDTIRLSLSAIRYKHLAEKLASPVDFSVRQLIASAARKSQEQPGGKAALRIEHLRKICHDLSDRPVDVRDRAVLLIGFRSGWRRSELAALRLSDAIVSDDGIKLHMGRSKTDQEGRGRDVAIRKGKSAYTCPLRALRAWLDVRGLRKGPLFFRFTRWGAMTNDPMTGRAICDLVKRAVERIGEDPRNFGAHSLRSGLVTAAVEAGKSEIMIMDRTGHKSIATVKRYLKSTNLFALDPLDGVL